MSLQQLRIYQQDNHLANLFHFWERTMLTVLWSPHDIWIRSFVTVACHEKARPSVDEGLWVNGHLCKCSNWLVFTTLVPYLLWLKIAGFFLNSLSLYWGKLRNSFPPGTFAYLFKKLVSVLWLLYPQITGLCDCGHFVRTTNFHSRRINGIVTDLLTMLGLFLNKFWSNFNFRISIMH